MLRVVVAMVELDDGRRLLLLRIAAIVPKRSMAIYDECHGFVSARLGRPLFVPHPFWAMVVGVAVVRVLVGAALEVCCSNICSLCESSVIFGMDIGNAPDAR